MASEPPAPSDELDAFTVDNSFDYSLRFNASDDYGFGSTDSNFSTSHTSSSRGNSSAPRSSQAEDVYEWSNQYFQRQSHHHGYLDDGFGSAESTLSTPHTVSSLGHSSVPRSSQAEDIVGWSNSHLQLQGYHDHLGDGDLSKEIEGVSCNLDISFDSPGISDSSLNSPEDDFLRNNNWNLLAELGNYTFNRLWSASSRHNHNVSQPQQMRHDLENSMSNEFSDQASWNADDRFIPVSQAPVLPFGQEATIPRQLFTPVIEDQNVPRPMVTYPSNPPRTMNATEPSNMSGQEENSQYSIAIDIFPQFLEAPPLGIGPRLLETIANYPNTTPPVQDILWSSPPNPVATSCYENSTSTTQLMPTRLSGPAFAETSENLSGGTTVTNLVPSRRRKNVPIRPALKKSYPGTLHAPISQAHRQQFYSHKEVRLQPRHGDRRGPTEKEKRNAKEVREIGACVMCVMKKLKCDSKEICEACQTMAKVKHPKLVPRHICLSRDGILGFRQGIHDFFYTNTRVGNPLNLPTTLQGSWRMITIGDRVSGNKVIFPKKVPLIVRVREYETYDLDTALVWSEGSRKSALASYIIDPITLPIVSRLEEWGRNLFLEASEVPDFRPYIMDKFLFAYWNAKPYLRYRRLVDLTIRLVALSTWLYESHPITSVENVNNQNLPLFSIRDDRIERRLAGVARSQLLLIAAKQFEATEEKFLYTVDSLMRSPGCSPQNAVIPGLCLRRMAVLYRLAFKRYKKFVNDSWMLQKVKNPKAMYEALTTAYSLIYSGAKNAFSIEWRVKDCLGAFGNDEELSDLFVKVMNYDREYCQKNLNDEDDVHLKILFLERKKGGGPRSR